MLERHSMSWENSGCYLSSAVCYWTTDSWREGRKPDELQRHRSWSKTSYSLYSFFILEVFSFLSPSATCCITFWLKFLTSYTFHNSLRHLAIQTILPLHFWSGHWKWWSTKSMLRSCCRTGIGEPRNIKWCTPDRHPGNQHLLWGIQVFW